LKAWLMYTGTALLVTLLAAGIATVFVGPEARAAVWFSAGLAYVVQLLAFGALIAVRTRNELFLAGWLIGMIARFAVVGLVAALLSRDEFVPSAPALVSLVGFLFLLVLVEPFFLRRGLQAK
jgi:hypothetical protein